MDRLVRPGDALAWSEAARRAGERIVLVPTMGALHRGHLHLVDLARRHGTRVVVSVFVNPIQFDRSDDFEAYPRPLDADAAACAAAGVDALYAPTPAAMYPPGFETYVEPGGLAESMEGAHRPGHFRGVATVVTKLLSAVRPHAALFGEKDFQQLAVVRRLVADLDLGVEIVGVPTVREPDGLALSSRNARLTPEDRAAAVVVPQALHAAAAVHAAGGRDPAAIEHAASEVVAREPRARLEYVRVVDSISLQRPDRVAADSVITTAVWFGPVRLIDNLRLP